MNVWRNQIAPQAITTCTSYNLGKPETILHQMALYPRSQIWWTYSLSILYAYSNIFLVVDRWLGLVWQQCIFGSKLPRRLKHVQFLWSLLCGSTLWLILIDQNTTVFKNEHWPQQKLKSFLWDAAVDLEEQNG